MLVSQWEPGIKPFHVFDGIDGNAAFTDLSQNTIGVAVNSIESGTIKSGAEANGVLVLSQVVKTAVRIFRQPQTRE